MNLSKRMQPQHQQGNTHLKITTVYKSKVVYFSPYTILLWDGKDKLTRYCHEQSRFLTKLYLQRKRKYICLKWTVYSKENNINLQFHCQKERDKQEKTKYMYTDTESERKERWLGRNVTVMLLLTHILNPVAYMAVVNHWIMEKQHCRRNKQGKDNRWESFWDILTGLCTLVQHSNRERYDANIYLR